jgi:hypothetical protein
MKPYGFRSTGGATGGTKGLSGRRKSKDTPHRRRSLRVDKKAARQHGALAVRTGTMQDMLFDCN